MNAEMLCTDCRDAGQDVIAYHVLRSGTRLCAEHFRKRMGQGLFSPRAKEEVMPVKSDIDWEQVRKEKGAGTSAPILAKKYGVHVSSIYNHTTNGNGHAGGGKKRAPLTRRAKSARETNGSVMSNGGFTTVDLLAELRKRRDALTAAIAAIEGMA